MLHLHELLGELLGHTDNQKGYYTYFFRELIVNDLVLPSEIKAWGQKSKERYNGRLLNLEVIEMKRQSFRGKVVYKWHPSFYASISQLWKAIKRAK